MKTVNLPITTCPECPHYTGDRDYTSDSFEFCTRWICKHPDVGKKKYQEICRLGR